MKTLQQAIQDNAGRQAQALAKHLAASHLNDWDDLTKSKLNDFKDYLTREVAPSSARTYFAVLKTIIGRYEEEVDIPCEHFRNVLRSKNDKPVKTYLTREELERLERVRTTTPTERYVLSCFMVGAYTGMRVSDTMEVSVENIKDGMLTYVSIKTGVHATVPCGERVARHIAFISEHRQAISQAGYNKAIQRLCKRAGIDERVKVHHGGKDYTKEKWECISSHSARISFCTNLATLEVPITDLKQMAGHTNIQMTERYICKTEVKLNERAKQYFQ